MTPTRDEIERAIDWFKTAIGASLPRSKAQEDVYDTALAVLTQALEPKKCPVHNDTRCYCYPLPELCEDCEGHGFIGHAKDGRLISCESCGGHEDSLGTGLKEALEPRCEYQRGTHCNLPSQNKSDSEWFYESKKWEIECKRYREALERIAKNECGWCSARYKAKIAFNEGKEEK